ncbi:MULTISPECIES: zinc-binding dehydrogenase [Anaerostipes]|uniref:zinc-binding dehydrogenase n=1 Tax=Anaerostipes TaxID=207244 RepID=UPI0009535C8B|nr:MULTISPECIES: zinc-binding dehydrogenase [unclassified Anaerostipes]MCI5624156.1 zinc-binding dehydrogenase [Anaerostipes sp.]MDY2725719.1 zinc-binding dehydrogenase [Anaerostipes faecalis]OLR59718.1 L-sorbose 1-phosphate reductase [Anaerostipes sp. 494a]
MKAKAVRMHGVNDLRLEEFELPELKEDEILVRIMTDSVCMSTYKEANQGSKHIRVPEDIEEHPVIVGHEFSGKIVEVGEKWKDQYEVGQTFAMYPGIPGQLYAPGYSYEFFGGAATYCIIPAAAIEAKSLMPIDSECFYELSTTEPIFCIAGGFHSNIHLKPNSHEVISGTKKDGNMIILGGCGPMGLGAISYAMSLENHPKRLVVTEISDERLKRASEILSVELAEEKGIELHYINTAKLDDEIAELMEITEGKGYDDVFVFTPIKSVAETGNAILAMDGCMNLFAGPADNQFKAEINLYDSHYKNTKIVGSSGGTRDDFIEALELIKNKEINPAVMVTHVGGINAYSDAVINLPKIPGGKKLIYQQFDMPLTAIDDFAKLGEEDPLMKDLADACERNKGLWNPEAEQILLKHYGVIK